MHKRGSFLFALLLSGVLLLSLMSCRKSLSERVSEKVSEKKVEGVAKAQGEDIDIDKSGEQFSVDMSDLPEGWPESMWVPASIEVVYGGATQAGDATTWILNAGYSGPPKELFELYKEKMSDWEILSESATDTDKGGTYVLQITQGSVEAGISITGDGDRASVVYRVTER